MLEGRCLHPDPLNTGARDWNITTITVMLMIHTAIANGCHDTKETQNRKGHAPILMIRVLIVTIDEKDTFILDVCSKNCLEARMDGLLIY